MKAVQLKSKGNFWGTMRHPKKFSVARSTVIIGVMSSVLMMFCLVDAASLAAADDGDELSPREGFRQLEQQQRQQQDDLNHNMKIFMTSSSSSSGDNVPNSPARGSRRDDEQDEKVVEMLQEEQVLPLQAAELLLEKYEQNVEQEKNVASEEEQQRQTHHHHHHRRPAPESLLPQALPLQQEEPIITLAESPPVMMQMGRSASSGRSLFSDDFEKRTSELCGTSASLECGKRILSLIEGQEMSELSVHMKCDLRDDFLKCIDTQKRECLEVATKSSVLPELPPKEDIKMERSKLWKVLWTAGGCVLAD